MELKGSCHCKSVQFTVQSKYPYPYNVCYCSICRKTAGGGGYAINLASNYSTLEVKGGEALSIYCAKVTDSDTQEMRKSSAQRNFCRHCASALWLWDSFYPDVAYLFASAIDTPLPIAPEHTHFMLLSKPAWVEPCLRKGDKTFDEYPIESIVEWHKRLGLETP